MINFRVSEPSKVPSNNAEILIPVESCPGAKVMLDEKGSPSYDIVRPVAWDYIGFNDKILKALKNSDLMVFGSLAARNEVSANTLLQMLDLAPTKVFDVNLRPPYYQRELLEDLI